MKLSEAYRQLEYAPPIEHERRVMEASRGMLDLRHLGTSVRTLVELYLDLELATRSVGYQNLHHLNFLCVCLSGKQADYLRHELKHIHVALDLDVDLARVRFFPHDGGDHVIRGHRYYTWGIFCDHAVKELAGRERTFGPYALVRTIRHVGERYVALDRDGRRVCFLTRQGMTDLINESTCPIHYRESSSVPSTTFGAWSREDLEPGIRLARAFEL